MRVPWSCGRFELELRRRWARGAVTALGLCVALGVGAHGEKKKNAPWVELPLEGLGFPGVSSVFLGSGSSVLTVNFIDSSHLLVTYGLRKLVPRLEHDPAGDDDRLVAGEVVELPSGRIEARTEWHMHDHGRYLWSLGRGRFLLRIGEQLYTMAPLREGGKAGFARTVFPSGSLRPSLVTVSPDGEVVTLETVEAQPEDSGGTKVYLGDEDTAPATKSKTVIDFFRIQEDGTGTAVMKAAGEVLSPSPILLPVDGDGYLWPEAVGGGDWAVTFDPYEGKTVQVGRVRSSCFPRLQMVSRTEFVALTCQGSDESIRMAAYGLDGQDTWEESVGELGFPNFAFAPAAGRFAISGSWAGPATAVVAGVQGPPAAPRQEVRVYQNASGDLLLKVECTPAFKTAENFDLSADGMLAAVVREGAIAVYKLPPLTKKDQQDMAEIAAFTPPASTSDVVLRRLTTPVKVKRASVQAPPEALRPSGLGPKADDAMVTGGGVAPPRKPPTLLKPGEKPEFGSANPELQRQ
jgi:hypothetical protein